MKKVFSTLTFVMALFLVSCMSEIKDFSSTGQKGEVILSIGNSSSRLISPAEGFSWRDVEIWTAEFTEKTGKCDKLYFYDLDFSTENQVSKQLPVGSYSVYLYGFASGVDSTIQVKYSGSAEVEISEESTESVPLSIFVSPEKTAEGKGSFEFTLTISTDSNDQISDVAAVLEAKSASFSNVTLIVAEASEASGSYTLSAADIPSGFYDLSIKCTVGETSGKEVFKNYFDSVVEIIDGLNTTGSKNITVTTGSIKKYYCTTGESKGNGLWKAYPANINEVLTTVKDATVTDVNIHMTDGIPEIDLAKIGSKHYSIYNSNKEIVYTIDGTETAGTEPDIGIANIASLSLKDSSGSNLMADITSYRVESSFSRLSLILNNSTSVKGCPGITQVVFANTEYNSYYAEHPFYIASTEDCDVSLGETLTKNYMVTKKTVSISETESSWYYYVVPAGDSAISVQGIPAWSLSVSPVMETGDSTYTVFAGDDVTFKAEFNEEFTPDSYAWYINGEQYSTEAEVSINFSQLDAGKYNLADSNTVLCVISKNGEYTSKAVAITVSEHTAETYVLYENSVSSGNYNIKYTYSQPLGYTPIVDNIEDFCTDESGNIYTLSSSGGVVTKYVKSLSGFTQEESYTIPDLLTSIDIGFTYECIKESNGNIFVSGSVYLENSYSSVHSCLKLSITDTNAVVSDLGNFTESVTMFCPYNGGEYIYAIELDSDNNIYTLRKYECGSGALTVSNVSATLYSARNSDETAVLKDYAASGYFYLNDMYSTGGYVYVTASETNSSPYDVDALIKDNAVSRGGVIKFSGDDLSVIADDSGALIYGWDSANVSVNTDDDVTNAHASPDTTFYGAEKIIAVKPEEIVIADDGFEFTGTGKANLKQKNRVVTFNLTTMAITGVVDVDSEFDSTFSGSAFN